MMEVSYSPIMLEQGILFFKSINVRQASLVAASVVLLSALIALQNLGIFPLGPGDFFFFAGLAFLIALYRPGWAFLFFVAVLPLETVNLAPAELGIALRPYQLFGGVTMAALVLRALSKNLAFSLRRPSWREWSVAVLAAGGFVALVGAPDAGRALKQAVVVASFGVLYYLARQFFQNVGDLKAALPFVLASGMAVSLYAVWQNVRFAGGLGAFEVMPGRPNATFAEPDWLGMYLAMMAALVYGLLFYLDTKREGVFKKFPDSSVRALGILSLYGLLALFFVALILTVARSAWLGAALATLLFVAAVLTGGSKNVSEWRWRRALAQVSGITAVGLISLAIVSVFHLTTFQLSNRAQSVASGLQKITVACDGPVDLPEKIEGVDTLAQYGCRHIDLEDIDQEVAAGKTIRETYRDDPNVGIRRKIYGTVFSLIGGHLLTGIGWGSASGFLGTDERGAGLNASNAFLEVWLGSGLVGFVSFTALWFFGLYMAARTFFSETATEKQRTTALFVGLSGVGMTVFNLFNSGILLGFVWVWLAAAAVVFQKRS
jgi:hypothetical protein